MDARRFLNRIRIGDLGTILVVLVLVTPTASPALAQTVEESRERLRRLVELRDRMELLADSSDLAMARAAGIDSVRLGSLLLYAAPDQLAVVEEGAAAAWDALAGALGSEVNVLERVVVTVGFANDIVVSPKQMNRTPLTTYVSVGNADRVRRAILAELSNWLMAQLDSVFREWAGFVITVADTTVEWEELWIEFATGVSPLVQACETGAEPECLVALGIVPVENPIFDWHDAEGRRELVRRLPDYFLQDREAINVCVERRWDEICIAILEGLDGIAPPVTHSARQALLRFALSRSPGGYGRLLRSAGTGDSSIAIADVLAAAAGVDLRTVIREWRQRIAASRPEAVSVGWPTAVSTILWIGILLSIRAAATRGRRAATGTRERDAS